MYLNCWFNFVARTTDETFLISQFTVYATCTGKHAWANVAVVTCMQLLLHNYNYYVDYSTIDAGC